MSVPESTRSRWLVAAPWGVVLIGVLVMTVLFVLATGYLTADRRTSGAPDPAWPFAPAATPVPEESAADPASPPPSSPAAGTPSPVPSTGRPVSTTPAPPRTTGPRTTAPSTRPARSAPEPSGPELTGRYRVLAEYHDSFLGEVLVRNDSDSAQSWTVELRFRDEVDDLRSFWVEGGSRPGLDRVDGRYVFRSSAPLSGGRAEALRFHFERWGGGETPISCTVNGWPCTIR